MSEPNDRPDDRSILDEERLLRWVTPSQIIPEEGGLRISSAAFNNPELSVNIETLMVLQGRKPESLLDALPGFALTSIKAKQVRAFDLPIVLDCEPPEDPAHALVLGKKSKSFTNEMKRSHVWVVPPKQ